MCGIISIFQKHFWKYEQVKAYIDRMQDMNECMIGKVKTSVEFVISVGFLQSPGFVMTCQ